MKKLQFRIRLFEGANKLAEMVALEAARYNGQDKEMTTQLLWAFAMTLKELAPEYPADTSIELLSDSTMHIDVKIGEHYETVLIVEQIEVHELSTTPAPAETETN